MDRKLEIKELLKSLLGKADKAIDDNQYSENSEEVKESCKQLVDIAKSMEKYIEELKSL